ncbi:hypothetical protein [Candidatus Pelagibacter communis]|uniref:hypothetical protein n=1 Tax=Pelagibacter ubique TaxID=198252 RepID=UPI00065B4465|nr:hypothetical protein [Candidatus Pelagibacter ubique]
MRCFSKLIKLKNLYNLFLFLALLNIFFSTENSVAKTFSIKEIEISSPFNASFDKNKIINRGFVEAYEELILTIVQSKDQKKLQNSSTKEVKSLVETFSIVQESFIDEIYNLTLNVEFNKKSFFDLLEKKNVFPSSIIQKDLIFFPIEVDEEKNEIFLFSESQIFNNWNLKKEKYHQLNYILPNEDIDDYNLIKKNSNNLEDFDFREISKKYNFEDFIIMIVFKNNQEIRVLNQIVFNKNQNLKNFKFKNINLENLEDLKKFMDKQKTVFEDYWKLKNIINTSIKLDLNISVDNSNIIKIDQFEETLSSIELVNKFNIFKFDNKKNIYKVIFNGTRDQFLNVMKDYDYFFEIKNKIWVLE